MRGGDVEVRGENHQQPGNYCSFISEEINGATGRLVWVSLRENLVACGLHWKAGRARRGGRRRQDRKVVEERRKGGGRGGGAAGETVWGYAASISCPLSSKNWSSSWIRLHSTLTKSFGYPSPRPLFQLNFPRQMLTEKIDIECNIILHRSQGISFTKGWDLWCLRCLYLHTHSWGSVKR